MPIQVQSLEELEKIAQKGIECRIKRSKKDGKAKIKVRTKKYLYTYVVDKDRVDEILTKLNCKNVIDLEKQKPKAEKSKKQKKEKKEEEKQEKEKKEEITEKAPEEIKEKQVEEEKEEEKESEGEKNE